MRSNINIYVFRGLQIVAWIIFVGLCIEAGGLLVNYVFSVYKPSVISNLYQKLNLMEMYEKSQWTFHVMYSYILVIAILKAYLFYILILLLQKMNLTKPFSAYVSEQITKVSYCTFSIGVINYFAVSTTKNLSHKGYSVDSMNAFWVSTEAFILMAAIIYVISIIFKRGVELQQENELTV